MRSLFFFTQTGCLLPLLMFFNLFFGWLFFRPLVWLGFEAVLILLFILNGLVLSQKISRSAQRRGRVVDVEAEVVQERRKIK